MPKLTPPSPPLPYSWDFATWPSDVFPFDGQRARHVVRQNVGDLTRAGALARPGHKLVILGQGYSRWLASKAARVIDDYGIAPNLPEHAGKRGGTPGRVARERAARTLEQVETADSLPDPPQRRGFKPT